LTYILIQMICVLAVGEEFEILVLPERRLFWKSACGFVFSGEFASGNFARFHIGLVESVDADYRTSHRSRYLPSEEFLTELIHIVHCNAHNRMSGFLERVDRLV